MFLKKSSQGSGFIDLLIILPICPDLSRMGISSDFCNDNLHYCISCLNFRFQGLDLLHLPLLSLMIAADQTFEFPPISIWPMPGVASLTNSEGLFGLIQLRSWIISRLQNEIPPKIPHYHVGQVKSAKDIFILHQLNLKMPNVVPLP